MPAMIFTMLVVLVLAAAIIAVVVMGMEGTGRKQHPEIAEAMARTARHLNGEGEPPKALVQLFDEIDEVPDLNVRDIPDRLRSLRSAASARSALSAGSANAPEDSTAPEGAVTADTADVAEPDEVWAPAEAAPEASEVDDSAAQAMSEALAAPAADPAVDDPYGVVGTTGPEQDASVEQAEVLGDTVVRVRLPEGDDARA